MRKNTLVKNIILFVVSLLAILIGGSYTQRGAMLLTGRADSFQSKDIVRVDVILGTDVSKGEFSDGTAITMTEITFTGTVLWGADKGKSVVVTQNLNDLISGGDVVVQEGDLVYVYGQDGEYVVGSYVRLGGIAILAAAFFILLLLFARSKGLATIISLLLSVMFIFLVFVPAILSGKNIYLWTFVVCLYTIIINPLFVGGFNRKSYASQLGCFGGVAIAGALAFLMNNVLRITGIMDDDSMLLAALERPIDMKAIVFSMVLIGALGAAIDVSMSIATSIYEMNVTAGERRFGALFESGLNIGRDILGAQTGTLVLAYIGSSLAVVLLLVAYQSSIFELLNLEMVIIELLQTFIGGFTILLTIPATAFISSIMFSGAAGDKPQVLKAPAEKAQTQSQDNDRPIYKKQ